MLHEWQKLVDEVYNEVTTSSTDVYIVGLRDSTLFILTVQ
jgi:hypothetical protein